MAWILRILLKSQEAEGGAKSVKVDQIREAIKVLEILDRVRGTISWSLESMF
jgi:hypothetical protein